MATLVDDLIVRLVADAVLAGGAPSWVEGPKARIPDGDGPYGVITETGGTGAYTLHNARYPRPSAQLILIARSPAVARAAAHAALVSLCGDGTPAHPGVYNTTLNGTWYLQITAAQEPFPFPMDTQERARYVFNIDVIKAQAAP